MNGETCVCCGAVIPEGRQVCWICERRNDMRLIDADKLTADSDFVISHVALIKRCEMKHKSGCGAPTCEDCFARLFKYYEHLAPTVDAKPVKRGEIAHDKSTHYYFCRSCLFQIDKSDIPYYNFCPHCGAKFSKD